jgi:hypothetical protein
MWKTYPQFLWNNKLCGPTRILLKTYPQKMWKDPLFSIKALFTNLSTFDVDKFVKKCAEMRKYI